MVRHAPEWRRQQRRSANRTKSETWSANLAGLDHEGSTCSTRDTNPGLKLHAATNTVIQRLDRARFQPEVRFQRPQWFFDIDADWWNPEPIEAVAYLTRLFEGPEEPLYWFTDAQIAQGLTYLVSTSASGDNGWLYSTDVPVADRIHCVDSSVSLFAKLFLPRCAPHLSHLSDPATGPLNVVCYMWWDEFPCLALPGDPAL